MRRFLALLGAVAALNAAAAYGRAATKPNIVILYADDLGYGDVSCYNSVRGKIATPHIDRLAAQGMRFTDAHSSSGVCSPSRYTLLTGRYHWRTRLQQGIVKVWEHPLIAADRLTIGKLAQQQGYRTACIGKWHLGWDWPIADETRDHFEALARQPESAEATDEARAAWRTTFEKSIGGGPTTRGFHEYFGTDVPNWPPYCFIENDRTVGVPTELLPAKLLKNKLASLQGPALEGWRLESILPALAKRAERFIERQANPRQPFLLYVPLTSPHTPLAVNAPWKGKSGLGNDAADFILETDATVGRILQALDEAGAADNTLVFFTSDNGFAPYVGAKELEARGHYPSGPLRGYKGDAWEGGHRIPFIARWPGVIQSGRASDQLVHQADLLATFADILDAELPDDAGEDSVSLLPLFEGKDEPIREHAVSQSHGGLLAVRQGTWKLVVGPGGRGPRSGLAAKTRSRTAGQLYDLAEDLGETNNLYAERPGLVAELTDLLERLVTDGRSTPGKKQSNDVPVNWRRFLVPNKTP